jgi:methyl-accepting chemotaxis protein
LVNQNMNNIGEGVQQVSASEAALKAAADTTGRMKQYVSDIARAANEQSLGVTQGASGTESTGAGHSAKRGAGFPDGNRQSNA